MALVVKDRVKETTSTTGTGTLTLGGAVTGFQTFTSVLSNSDTTYYAIFESSTGQFEVGLGTFTSSGTTLARTTILESSNSGNAINLTAGAADVFITQPAEKAVYLDSSGHIAAADGRNVTNVAASTAATLATARDIGGVSFNGSASINLPGVNTSGNQDTSGNAATATTAGTVTTAAQPNITSLGTLTTLTVDDITINGSTISDAGDLTVDVDGDIILDAGGSDISLKSGSEYGKFNLSGNSLNIHSSISNGDIVFKGNDNGSTITALTLDMSEAGAATFNTSVTTPYLYVGTGSNDGTFYSDQAGRTAFANGQFYIQDSVSAFYNYASATYHGDSSGDAQYFRGNTLTGNSWSLTGAGAASFASVNINGALNAVDDIYLAGTLYHEGDTNTYLTFGTDTITLTTGGDSEVTVNSSGVRLGDTGNGYFQPVTGDYGSIQIDGGAHNNYEGYSIGGRVLFMHNNSTTTYLYNDVDNEAFIRMYNNGSVSLYFNGSVVLETSSSGVNVTGTAEVDTLQFSDGSTQTSAGASTGKAIAMAIVFG